MEISVYSLFPFARSSRASLSSRRAKKEKSKGRKEFNIKKLSFCVDMKIPRISASFPRRLFSSLLPLYIAVRLASPLPPSRPHLYDGRLSTGWSYCLARRTANRQIRLKNIDLATRARNMFVRLWYLLFRILNRAIIKKIHCRHKSIAINIHCR